MPKNGSENFTYTYRYFCNSYKFFPFMDYLGG